MLSFGNILIYAKITLFTVCPIPDLELATCTGRADRRLERTFKLQKQSERGRRRREGILLHKKWNFYFEQSRQCHVATFESNRPLGC